MGLVAWYPLTDVTDKTNKACGSYPYDLELKDTTGASSYWRQVCSHNYDEDGLFSTSDDFSKYVSHGDTTWAFFPAISQWDGTNYEFLYFEGTTRRRWSQTVDPNTATFSDTKAGGGNVTAIENMSGRGGMYKHTSGTNTYYCINNGTDGNWYGAIGAYQTWNGGFPGFSAMTKTMKLYVRVKAPLGESLRTSSMNIEYKTGKTGNAPTLTGTPQYYYTDEFIELKEEMSFTAWIKMTTVQATFFLDLRNSANKGYQPLYYSGTQFQFYSTVTGSYNCTYTLEANKWYHLCATINKDGCKIYVNNVLVGSDSTVKGSDFGKTFTKATIGRRYTSESGYCKGQINDVRIYDHELSTKERHEIYKARIVHYDFNDPTIVASTNLISGFGTLSRCTKIDTHSLSVDWVNNSGDTYYFPTLSEAMSSANTYTISCYCEGIGNNTVIYGISNNGGDYSWTLKDGYNELTFKPTDAIANRFFIDDIGTRVAIKYTMNNIQLEKRTCATPYVNGSRPASLLLDSSGFGHDTMEFNNIELAKNTGHGNYAAVFNGTDSYIKVPLIKENLFKEAYTINFWVKPKENGTRDVYFGDHQLTGTTKTYNLERNTSNYFRYYHGGSPDYNGTTDTASDTTGVKILKDVWTMVTVAYTPGTIKFYQNGVLKKSYTHTADVTKAGYYYIGRDSRTGTTAYNGEFGEFSIYATCLTDADILDLYQSKAQIDNSAILYTYTLNENQNNLQITKSGILKCKEIIEDHNPENSLKTYSINATAKTGTTGFAADDPTSNTIVTWYNGTNTVTIHKNAINISVTPASLLDEDNWSYTYNKATGVLTISVKSTKKEAICRALITYDINECNVKFKKDKTIKVNKINEWT